MDTPVNGRRLVPTGRFRIRPVRRWPRYLSLFAILSTACLGPGDFAFSWRSPLKSQFQCIPSRKHLVQVGRLDVADTLVIRSARPTATANGRRSHQGWEQQVAESTHSPSKLSSG
jgi:hypothetical protein